MFVSIAVATALAAQVDAPPPVSPPKPQPAVSQDADWRLLSRLPDRWVFIQGEKSRTKDLSKIVFSLTVYLTPIDVAEYSIDHVLDAEHFECDPRKAELRSRISFEVNGGILATNYGGISEPVIEGTLALLKVTTVCDNLPLSGPAAPSDKLAVGLAKGLSSQLPPADLEKLAPMGGWTVFNPPAPNIKP